MRLEIRDGTDAVKPLSRSGVQLGMPSLPTTTVAKVADYDMHPT